MIYGIVLSEGEMADEVFYQTKELMDAFSTGLMCGYGLYVADGSCRVFRSDDIDLDSFDETLSRVYGNKLPVQAVEKMRAFLQSQRPQALPGVVLEN